MSEETLCFHATLYLDNKKIGNVSNHGQGGPNDYHFKEHKMKVELESLAFDYVKEHNLLKNYSNEMQGEFALETMIEDKIERSEKEKLLKKQLRKDVILKNNKMSEDQIASYSKRKYKLTTKEMELRFYKELLNVSFNKNQNPIILNQLPFEQAYEIYFKGQENG